MIRFLQTEGPIKKIVLSGLLLLICGAMAITLIPGGLGSELTGTPGKGIVAKVSGEDITVEQVGEAARNMAQRQAQQYGANASMIMPFLMPRATQQAVNELINRQVELTEAQRMGFKATPQEVKDDLQHGRYAGTFFPGGNFIGEGEYKGLLQQNNLTPAMFEENVGKGSVISKLEALITGGACVSDDAIRKEFTKDDLQAYYNQHRDQYRVPEQIKVSHIWIKMPLPGPEGKIDEKGVADAQRRADELLKQLQNGAKFEDVAKKSSEDTGSANVGGSLGWIGKSQMGAEFEKAASALPKGKISGVVKTLDGFHIIRVDDKQDAHMKTLDEVKAEIEPAVKQQKTTEAAQKQAGSRGGGGVDGGRGWRGGKVCAGDGFHVAGLCSVPVAVGEAAVNDDVR